MLGELHGLFRNSDYETIFFSLFETVTADHERKFTHLHNLFFKETSVFYSRDYVDGYKNRNTTYDFLLAREIYKNLNLAFKRDGAANQSLGKWEIAAHVWKMVHTYGGDKDRLIDRRSTPSYLRDNERVQIKQTRAQVSRMSFARSQMRERYIGAAPMSVDGWLFKEFLKNLPDSFVVDKTVIMDGAAIHARPTDGEIRLNSKLPDALSVFPESELSPLAQLLRRRGGGDGVLLPPTKETFFEYGLDAQNRRVDEEDGRVSREDGGGEVPRSFQTPSRALTTVVRADEKKDFERDETTYFCPAANPVAPGAEYFTKYDVRKGDDGQIRAVQCVRKGVKDYKLGEHVRVLWQGAWRRAKIERLPEANKNTRTPSKTKVTNSPWFTVSLSDTNESVRVMISKIRPSKGKIRKLMAKHERMVEEIEARNRDVIAKRVAEWTAQRRRATDLRADLRMSRAFTSAEALDAVRVAARRMEKHEDAVRESIAPALRAWSASNAAETPGATRRAAALRPDPALTRSRTARGGVGLPGGGGTTSGAVPSATGAAGAAGPSASPTPAPPPVPRREMARLPRVYASFY
eukprot:jgi/Mesvir1/9248/Mv03724-RA.1